MGRPCRIVDSIETMQVQTEETTRGREDQKGQSLWRLRYINFYRSLSWYKKTAYFSVLSAILPYNDIPTKCESFLDCLFWYVPTHSQIRIL